MCEHNINAINDKNFEQNSGVVYKICLQHEAYMFTHQRINLWD